MDIVKVSNSFYSDCVAHGTESELLLNESGRPCVLLVNLMYKGNRRKFVIPLRSNIAPSAPKWQYFPLPPNKGTRSGRVHGLHYIKLWPITDKYIQSYHIDEDKYLLLVSGIINKHEREIIHACQTYLDQCARGNKHNMTPDIDGILSWL